MPQLFFFFFGEKMPQLDKCYVFASYPCVLIIFIETLFAISNPELYEVEVIDYRKQIKNDNDDYY